MRIWLVTTNLRLGGAEITIHKLARWLRKRGHEVRLILIERRADFSVPECLPVHFIEPLKKEATKGWLGKRLLAWRLRRWALSVGKPDLVISTLPFADEIVHLAGLKNVWYRIANPIQPQLAALRDINQAKARRREERFRRLYHGHNVIGISQGILDDLRTAGITPQRALTIYNAFDFDEIARAAEAPAPEVLREPFVVHASRFVPQKRHDVALDAFAAARLPHKFVLLTSCSRALQEMVRIRGLQNKVVIAGVRQNPFPWFARASALIHSSDFEGFGNVLVEALGCGTPVVSTDCPTGPREIMTGELRRFLSPPGDAQALARNLVACIETPPNIDRKDLLRFRKEVALEAIESLAALN